MQKKLLALMITVILFVMPMNVQAEGTGQYTEDDCPAHEVCLGNETGVVKWVGLSITHHGLYVYRYGTCYTCNTTYTNLYEIERTEPHDLRYESNYHMQNTTQHYYLYRCTVCKDVIFSQYNCPGPAGGGCIVITHGRPKVDVETE